MSKVHYIVKKDERVVVCVISDTEDYFMDYMVRHMYENNHLITGRWHDKYFLKNSYSGVARCAPDDEWNEEIGRKIAFNKAKEKLNNAFFKRAKAYVNAADSEFNQLIGIINNYGARLASDADKRGKEIDGLLGKKE